MARTLTMLPGRISSAPAFRESIPPRGLESQVGGYQRPVLTRPLVRLGADYRGSSRQVKQNVALSACFPLCSRLLRYAPPPKTGSRGSGADTQLIDLKDGVTLGEKIPCNLSI